MSNVTPIKKIMGKAEPYGLVPELGEILQSVNNYLSRFVAYPSEHARVTHALWIAHAHLIDNFETTPRLAFMSAEKASGKTRALEVTALLVPGPVASISASPSYIVRRIAKGQCTLLYDEIDGVFGTTKREESNVELRGVLNGGYRRGAKVQRCGEHGKTLEEYDAFSPVVVAGLRALPDMLASRAIVIRMKRRAPGEKIEPFRYRYHVQEAQPISEALQIWCELHGSKLQEAEPALPVGVEDRAADIWEPLLAIADEAGGDWPARARSAAVFFTKESADETLSRGVELLAHIRDAFGSEPKLLTKTLLERLCGRDESPWKDIRGKDLDDRGLAYRLKDYGIKSKDVKIAGACKKGYDVTQFHDAWKRLLPPSPPVVGDRGDRGDQIDNNNKKVAEVAEVADRVLGGDRRVCPACAADGYTECCHAGDGLELPAFLDRRNDKGD